MTATGPHPDFRFADRLRVRWAEVDAQRIVFNGHYLMYLDTAMGAYWRALALPYEDTLASLHGDLFLRKAGLEYDAPARYDDVLEVALRFEGTGTSSMRFSAAVRRGDERLVGGELLYVWTDAATRTPHRVPAPLVEAMRAFEAGEPMVRVEVGSWSELGGRAQPLRTAVFVEEQKIPAELEYDVADAEAVHAVAVNRLGQPLATGRLLRVDEPGAANVGRIGRMAVHRALRGSGVGRQVLEALANAARERGDRQVMLHAQESAVGFYRRAGFEPRGDFFVEAGIRHLEMVRDC